MVYLKAFKKKTKTSKVNIREYSSILEGGKTFSVFLLKNKSEGKYCLIWQVKGKYSRYPKKSINQVGKRKASDKLEKYLQQILDTKWGANLSKIDLKRF